MSRAPARPDLSQLGSKAPALAADDMTFRAMPLPSVELLPPLWISSHDFVGHAPQTANISDKLPRLACVDGIAGGHLRAANAIPDHQKKRSIVRRAGQSRLRQYGAPPPFPFGTVTPGALRQEQPLTAFQIIRRIVGVF